MWRRTAVSAISRRKRRAAFWRLTVRVSDLPPASASASACQGEPRCPARADTALGAVGGNPAAGAPANVYREWDEMATRFASADTTWGGHVTAVLGAAIACGVVIMVPAQLGTRLVLGAGVVVTIAILMRLCTRQDIVDVDPRTKRIHTRRRRAFGPDTVRDYSAEDIARLTATRIVDEGAAESFDLGVHMSDGRVYAIGVEQLEPAALARGRAFLDATGRGDLQPYV
jgi:hypothetical protein